MSKDFVILVVGLLVAAGGYYAFALRQAQLEVATAGCGGPCAAPPIGVPPAGGSSFVGEPTPTIEPPRAVRLGEGDLLGGIPVEGSLTVEDVRGWLADPTNHAVLLPELPPGLDGAQPDLHVPIDNPLTRAKIELGRQLFFDPRLSGDGSVSCASCHDPTHGFAQATPTGVGIGGRLGARNSPTVANRILSGAQFWDGRAASLEEQAIAPIASDVEMGISHRAAVALLRGIVGYRLQFERVFGASAEDTNAVTEVSQATEPATSAPVGSDAVTIENAARALAAFQRAVVTGPSAWDHHQRLTRFESAYAEELADPETLAEYEPELADEHEELVAAADTAPLSEAALRGAELFFGDRTGCTQCHAGANFTDERFHNLGVGLEPLAELDPEQPLPAELDQTLDWGRYAVTRDEADRGAFKTPTLRNVSQTAPYMHDGSQATLAEIVAWYVRGGADNPFRSPLLEPLDLDEAEQADLVAFLESLTGPWPTVETGRLPE